MMTTTEMLVRFLVESSWPFDAVMYDDEDKPVIPRPEVVRLVAEAYQDLEALPGKDMTEIEEYYLQFEDELGVSLPRG